MEWGERATYGVTMISPTMLRAPRVPARTVGIGLACLNGVGTEEDSGAEGEEDAGEELHGVRRWIN